MAQRRPDRTLGAGHDVFWEWCAKEQLRLQACRTCDRLQWPVVQVCEHCGGETFDWQRLSGRGRVVSWCAFYYDYYSGMLPTPYDVILIELEEGPLFLSNPVLFGGKLPRMGQDVVVAFKEGIDKAGLFFLPMFSPS